MTSAEQLMVIATKDELEVGQAIESISAIPHVTLFPWMTLQSNQWEAFDARMHDIISDTQARNMRGAKELEFETRKGTVKVRELHGLDYDLRVDLANIAIDLNVTYDPTYAGENTIAHTSETPNFKLLEGEVFPISAMTVISKDVEQQQKVVKAIYKWRHASKWYL